MPYTLPEHLITWAWTPYRVAIAAKQDSNLTDLELPLDVFNPEEEAAAVHFASIKDGLPFNWLWLFPSKEEAIALRLLPWGVEKGVFSDSPEISLIEATIPRKGLQIGLPREIEILGFPCTWYADMLDRYDPMFGGERIQQVWIGFNLKQFKAVQTLIGSVSAVLEVDEFVKFSRR